MALIEVLMLTMASKPMLKESEDVQYVNKIEGSVIPADTNYIEWEETVDTVYTDNENIIHVNFKNNEKSIRKVYNTKWVD